jgi:hypothetical protein
MDHEHSPKTKKKDAPSIDGDEGAIEVEALRACPLSRIDRLFPSPVVPLASNRRSSRGTRSTDIGPCATSENVDFPR